MKSLEPNVAQSSVGSDASLPHSSFDATAQRRLNLQYEIARVLADAGNLRDATHRLFKTICNLEGFVAASLWKISADSECLQYVDFWTDENPALVSFVSESLTLRIAPRMGLAGRAWASGRPVWIADIRQVPDLPPPAVKVGLRSGMAFPIAIQGEIKGVMVFWSFDQREESRAMLDMFHAISNQIGQYMARQMQSEKVLRLSRVHAVMSGINAAIVKTRGRQQLFDEICRIAVEDGKFGIAWIGEFDAAKQDITPVAWAGYDAGTLVALNNSTARDDLPGGQTLVGRAVRSGQPVFANNLMSETSIGGKRRLEALRQGYHSLCVVPLLLNNSVIGTMSLFVKEVGFFNPDEISLLAELSGNISFALEHLEHKAELTYLTNRDALTGMANRSLLIEYLQQAMALADRDRHLVAIAVLKLENLRTINDSLGQGAGDALLKIVASRIGASIRKADNLAQLSGSEFALVLPLKSDAIAVTNVMDRLTSSVFSQSTATGILQKVLDDIRQPVALDDQEFNLSCSMGVSLYPQDGVNAQVLLKNAATACPPAHPLAGKALQFYSAEFNEHVEKRLVLHASLRHAIERQEFELYYQPKLHLQSGEVSGCEALLRWNAPGRAQVLPGEFVPVLEDTGLIIDVGRWVMERAVVDHQKWRQASGWHPRIAINVSAVQLAQKSFPSVVERVLAGQKSVDVGLDMEITESQIMQDLAANIPKLQAIRAMGVNIIIDDFGMGYSSLSYLAKLPGNALKIDRSFIHELESSNEMVTIVSTIISLAHALGLQVIAEGVESEMQKSMLRDLKCDEIQGYLVSRPLPRASLDNWQREITLPRKPFS